ncbi:hypothetical protein HK102_006536, partial [Quaeritorhiza haematococci]
REPDFVNYAPVPMSPFDEEKSFLITLVDSIQQYRKHFLNIPTTAFHREASRVIQKHLPEFQTVFMQQKIHQQKQRQQSPTKHQHQSHQQQHQNQPQSQSQDYQDEQSQSNLHVHQSHPQPQATSSIPGLSLEPNLPVGARPSIVVDSSETSVPGLLSASKNIINYQGPAESSQISDAASIFSADWFGGNMSSLDMDLAASRNFDEDGDGLEIGGSKGSTEGVGGGGGAHRTDLRHDEAGNGGGGGGRGGFGDATASGCGAKMNIRKSTGGENSQQQQVTGCELLKRLNAELEAVVPVHHIQWSRVCHFVDVDMNKILDKLGKQQGLGRRVATESDSSTPSLVPFCRSLLRFQISTSFSELFVNHRFFLSISVAIGTLNVSVPNVAFFIGAKIFRNQWNMPSVWVGVGYIIDLNAAGLDVISSAAEREY